jgi:hypothetical protein
MSGAAATGVAPITFIPTSKGFDTGILGGFRLGLVVPLADISDANFTLNCFEQSGSTQPRFSNS